MRKTSKQLIAVFMTLVMLLTMTALPVAAEGEANVAKIGETEYATLKDAIDAASTEEVQTVTLLRDAEGSGVVIDKSVTIDFADYTYTFTTPAVGSTGTQTLGFQILDGNTVTLKNGSLKVSESHKTEYAMLIQNYANLSISDMTLDGEYLDRHTIKDYKYSYVLSNNCGTVSLENVTFLGNSDGDAYAFDACKYLSYTAPTVTATNCTVTGMVEVTGGTLTVNGGTYKPTAQCTDAFIVSSGSLTLGGNVSVTGGELDESTAVWALGTGNVTINGGTYTFKMPVSEDVAQGYNDLIYAKENATITINGGHFSGPARDSDGVRFLLNKNDDHNATATIEVKGGTFVNFNPADTNTEPADANDNFVAEGYCINAKETGSVNDVKTYDYTVGYHKLVHKIATEATCTKGGMEEHWYCESCNNYYKSEDATESTPVDEFVISVIPHTFTKTEAKDPTCVDGHTAYWYCSACELYYTSDTGDFSGFSESSLEDNTKIEATREHTMTKIEGYKATCSKDGRKDYWHCSSCDLYYFTEDGQNKGYDKDEINEEAIIPHTNDDHTLVEVPAVEPTCTEDGLEFHWRCSVCGAGRMYNPEITQPIRDKDTFENNILPGLIIPATGEHKLTEVPAVEGNCTTDSYPAYWHCEDCDKYALSEDGQLYNKDQFEALINAAGSVVPAEGHKLTKVEAVKPTCDKEGTVEHYKCSVCGALFADAEGTKALTASEIVAPATEKHSMTKIEGYEPTCGKEGRADYWYCSICEYNYFTEDGQYNGYDNEEIKEQAIIVRTGDHTLKEVPAVAPTYTEDGHEAYWQCSECGACSVAEHGQPVINKSMFEQHLLPSLTIPKLIEIKEETAEIAPEAVDTAIEEAKTEEIVIDLVEVSKDDSSESETAPAVQAATLPTESLDKVAKISEKATLTVTMTDASVTMDSKTMAAVSEQSKGETVTLKVEKIETETLTKEQQAAVEKKDVAVVISATMISNDTAISDFKGGLVTIAVPFEVPAGYKGEDFKVYYLDDEGNLTEHITKYENGCLVFSTTHFSDYVIINTAATDASTPNTGAHENVAVYAVAMVFAMIAVVSLIVGKKASAR